MKTMVNQQNRMKLPLESIVATLVIAMSLASHGVEAAWNPFGKKSYTPLTFFTVPSGLIPECDAMEATVREVEKELDVRVERLDILRDPSAEAALALLTQKSPPFLYNRESCQTVHIPPKQLSGDGGTKDMPVSVNKERVRAWAKGRYLPAIPFEAQTKVKSPVMMASKDERAIEQEELLEDMGLTPTQREGKEAMRQRTEEKAKERRQ